MVNEATSAQNGQTAARVNSAQPKTWVALGASAGGLEALRALVSQLTPDLPATYIVAQHLAPHHRSMLTEIISRETSLGVHDVVDGMEPESGHIYITPPNANCMVDGNILRLLEPPAVVAAPKPSVDILFTTMAEAHGDHTVGVVLSGTLSDGSDGIRAVREHGGVTIAQDEATAKYSSMPVSAVETGCVDLVMAPDEIGAQMRRIIRQPRDLAALKASPLRLDAMGELISLLVECTGVNFKHYKTATFQRRVERRMAALHVASLDDYVNVASGSEAEVDELFRDLLISVTSFFRDPGEFQTIEPAINELVKTKAGEPIRVWVAGTATGEEAYSIAILFAEAMGGIARFENSQIQIFATDLDENAIGVARRGFYSETSLDEVPRAYVDEYFELAPGGYTVKKGVRDKVVFSVHDVTSDPPFLKLDLITCRNLLIYFQPVLQASVFGRFHYSLVPNGILFLGKSENVAAAETLFRQAGSESHIFYQRPSATPISLRETFLSGSATGMARPTSAPAKPAAPALDDGKLAMVEAQFESLIRGLGDAAMLLSPELNVLRVYGESARYVSISEGPLTTGADSLLVDPYRQDVRVLVPGCIRQKRVMRGMSRQIDDTSAHERVVVYPIVDPASGPWGGTDSGEMEVLALVVFTQWEETDFSGDSSDFDGEAADAVDRLRRELAIAQTNLQHTVEELETSNEELQALNEELQSSNEELQSSNEELATSNEELQSTNEELSTVNEELQVNSLQLDVANQSLQSILDNVAVPMIVVDRQLNITHTSAASEGLFGVSPDLVLPHLSRCVLPPGFPDLTTAVQRSLETSGRVDFEINSPSRSARMLVVPNFEASGELVGAIVLISDSTSALQESNIQLNTAARVAGVGYMTSDFIKGESRWSEQMLRIAGVDDGLDFNPSEDNGWGFDLLIGESRALLDEKLAELRANTTPFDIEVEIIDLQGVHKTIRLSGSAGLGSKGEVVGWLGVAVDISEQADRETKLEATLQELSRSNEELNRFSYVCSHDMKEPVRMIEGLAELLLDENVSADPIQRDAILHRITSNMGRLRSTIDSLLAYSRIDAKVEDNSIDLRDVVTEMDESLSLVIEEHNAELIVGDLPEVVGARLHFIQLFQNLIGNALKFSDKQNPVVQISSAEDGDHIHLVIEDNGPGVPEEFRQQIFNLFDRLHRQDEVEGVGLGLSICQRIVAQYGGTIECTESELGGARFDIILPAQQVTQ